MPRKRKKKPRKRKKRKREDEMIVRGKSDSGDLILDFQHYIQHYEGYHGEKHPGWYALTEEQKNTVIDSMLLIKRAGKLPDVRDAEAFGEALDKLIEAAKVETPPDTIPSASDVKGIEVLREQAKAILEQRPDLGKALQDDLDGGWKPPWNRIQRRKFLIEKYLATVETFRLASEGKNLVGKEPDEPPEMEEYSKQLTRKAWSIAREAHIFEIPNQLAGVLYHQVDRHLCDLAGVEWTPPGSRDIPEDESKHYTSTLLHYRKRQMLPEHMPFDSLYLGVVPPIPLSDVQMDLWGCKYGPAHLYGFLVTRDSVITLIIQDEKFSPQWEMVDNSWVRSLTSTPWWVPWIIEWINDHQTVIEESTKSGSYRRAYKKAAKSKKISKPIPPPYYTVTMRDELLREDDWLKKLQRRARAVARKKCEHRFDVRGHWCVRIARGPLPLEPKMEAKLRKDKRRKIFTTGQPDAETAAHLAKRGAPRKRVDEWLAVLVYWRDDHRRGPDDGPYIPSIRRSSRTQEAA